MDFSLRMVVSLLLGALIILAITVVVQQNAGNFQSFMGEFMNLS